MFRAGPRLRFVVIRAPSQHEVKLAGEAVWLGEHLAKLSHMGCKLESKSEHRVSSVSFQPPFLSRISDVSSCSSQKTEGNSPPDIVSSETQDRQRTGIGESNPKFPTPCNHSHLPTVLLR